MRGSVRRRVATAPVPVAVALSVALGAAALLAASAGPASAQRFGRRGPPAEVDGAAGEFPYDGRLTFARLRFEPRSVWGGWSRGQAPWAHDYPYAERNFMTILSEITTARTFRGGSRIVALDDPALFHYPIAYMSEPGHWTLDEAETAGLRAYLLKGGFIIFDDFSGRDWVNFEEMMRRVLPDVRFVPMTVDHPLFHAFFEIETLELRHPNYRGYTASFFGVFEDNDPRKRLLAIVNYNTDIGDYFEYSDTGFLPVDLSNEAYKLGVNYWVYALTR
jgi:hypothetical protein